MATEFILHKVDIDEIEHEDVKAERQQNPAAVWEAYEMRLLDLTGCCEAGAPLFVLYSPEQKQARVCGGVYCEWLPVKSPEDAANQYLRNKP